MEFADLAFGNGDQLHAGEDGLLEESGDLFLVAADEVQCLGDHDVDAALANILKQLLIPRPASRARTPQAFWFNRRNHR